MNINDLTKKELDELISAGVQIIGKNTFLNVIDLLGYEIDKNMSFNYINSGKALNTQTGIARFYKNKAKSVSLREKDSKLSFANVNARKDKNFESLMEFRRNTAVFHHGKIWEY